MRFLISMVFVGMLGFSSQAFAERFLNSGAEVILVKGKVVAENWDTDVHYTRVIYKSTYYACMSYIDPASPSKMVISCKNAY